MAAKLGWAWIGVGVEWGSDLILELSGVIAFVTVKD